MQSNNPLVYVSESKIHGKGLFARQYIPKDTIIGIIKTQAVKEDGPYVLWSEDMTECAEVVCEFKYINHSTQPNVAYFDDNTVIALQDIIQHTELTHNYGAEDAFVAGDHITSDVIDNFA